MGAPEVFDELLSLRRLEVALRRSDGRMFEQGLARLSHEVASKHPFKHHQAWQGLLQSASDSPVLSDALKEQLREAINRLMAIETRVAAAPAPRPVDEAEPVAEADPQAPAIALVLGWQSRLRDAALSRAFLSWLTRSGAQSAGAGQLERWLREDRLTLEQLINRANLALAAAHAGVGTHELSWVDTLFAGVCRVLNETAEPPLMSVAEAIAPLGPVSVLVAEPGLSWEQAYPAGSFRRSPDGDGRMDLIKLAGSVDGFYCQACARLTAGGGDPQPLMVACAECGAPARPLLVPLDSPHFWPPAIREQWAWGAEALAAASTWVLIEPGAPRDDAFERWLLSGLDGDRRVLVLSDDDEVLKAWQTELGDRPVGAVVTSHGPADQVLAYLLQGGVPELKSPPAPRPMGPLAKKKSRR